MRHESSESISIWSAAGESDFHAHQDAGFAAVVERFDGHHVISRREQKGEVVFRERFPIAAFADIAAIEIQVVGIVRGDAEQGLPDVVVLGDEEGFPEAANLLVLEIRGPDPGTQAELINGFLSLRRDLLRLGERVIVGGNFFAKNEDGEAGQREREEEMAVLGNPLPRKIFGRTKISGKRLFWGEQAHVSGVEITRCCAQSNSAVASPGWGMDSFARQSQDILILNQLSSP